MPWKVFPQVPSHRVRMALRFPLSLMTVSRRMREPARRDLFSMEYPASDLVDHPIKKLEDPLEFIESTA